MIPVHCVAQKLEKAYNENLGEYIKGKERGKYDRRYRKSCKKCECVCFDGILQFLRGTLADKKTSDFDKRTLLNIHI